MKKIITLLVVTLTLHSFAQQDTQYGLYQFNQMAINPGYTGSRDAIAAVIDYRNQWAGFSGAPKTFAATIHAPMFNNKIGLGVNVINDQIGAKSVNGLYGNAAYIAKLNNSCNLSFGLRAGLLNYQFNFNKVTYKDGNEPTIGDLTSLNKSAIDIDAGLFLKSNKFFAGISATHLTQAKIYSKNAEVTVNNVPQVVNSSYVLNSHVFIIVGRAFSFSENCLFNPTIMLKTVGKQTTMDINLNFLIMKRIWLGSFLRSGYGIGFLTQVYATDKLRIGYSFDTGAGAQKNLGSSHELMLGFDFGNYKSKTLSPRFL